ncbi:hypothetical protein C8R46DRAFT_1094112 [Mycena filopes]|nr:hypothetical protein C8R46DRAFT_1094112 [Mycena filopes]
MSSPTLPAHPGPLKAPVYTVRDEHKLSALSKLFPVAAGVFTKHGSGKVALHLSAQHAGIDLPVYGVAGVVEGAVEILKTDYITAVEVKVEGHLRLIETGEGGKSDTTLVSETAALWTQDANNSVCPLTLPFSITLPTTFEEDGETYALPPTYFVELEGIPGFSATVEYSVSAIAHKNASILHPTPLLHHGNVTVSTPFIYRSRTRPVHPIPPPLEYKGGAFIDDPEWQLHQSVIKASAGSSSFLNDITTKFYLPESGIFWGSGAIPFHLTLASDAATLAAFQNLPTTGDAENPPATRVQLLRQSMMHIRGTATRRANIDMRHDKYIGEGTFRLVGTSPTSLAYSGEIKMASPIEATGFRSGGLFVQDFVVLSVTPPDGRKELTIVELREAIHVLLTTDPE